MPKNIIRSFIELTDRQSVNMTGTTKYNAMPAKCNKQWAIGLSIPERTDPLKGELFDIKIEYKLG